MERGGLSSTIPSSIGRLSKLYFLDLDFNSLSGAIPAEISQLVDLEQLHVVLLADVLGVEARLGLVDRGAGQRLELLDLLLLDLERVPQRTAFHVTTNEFVPPDLSLLDESAGADCEMEGSPDVPVSKLCRQQRARSDLIT